MGAGFYYNVDKTGAVIWSLITQGKSEIEIIGLISKHTQAESSQISGPIKTFLEDLQKEDLIAIDPSFLRSSCLQRENNNRASKYSIPHAGAQ